MTKKSLPVSIEIEGEVRKANEAIAIRPVGGEALTFLTRKLFNTMLFHAQKQGMQKRTFVMPLKAITKGADFDSHDIQLIKEHLRKMKRSEVEWNSPGKEWGISSLVSEAVIRKEAGELVLYWEYGSSIQERLLDPRQYTPVALAYQAIMRTHAGLAMLEICLRYKTFSAGLSERRPWEWWYGVLTGNTDSEDVGSRKYFYRYFKRDTIKPAIQEVNSLTEFDVELIEHTQGRKVVDLQFKIGKREQKTLELNSQIIDASLITRMMRLGLKEQDAQKIYSSYEKNRIRSALDVTEKKMRSKAKPESPIAYFRSALSADWLHPVEQCPTPAVPKKEALPNPEKLAARKAAMESFKALPDSEQKELMAKFSATLKGPPAKAYETHGLNHPLTGPAFVGWLMARSA